MCKLRFVEEEGSKFSFSTKFKAVRKNIGTRVPLRSLFGNLDQIYLVLNEDSQVSNLY